MSQTAKRAPLVAPRTEKKPGHRELTSLGTVVYGDSGEVARFTTDGVRFEPPAGANDIYPPAIRWRDDWPIVLGMVVIWLLCLGGGLWAAHQLGWV